MTVLTPANAFPGMPFPQHKSGQTTTVQSYLYPGAVLPNPNPPPPSVLSYTNAFPNLAFPQHKSGQTAIQSFLFPGAVQPIVNVAAAGTPFAQADWPDSHIALLRAGGEVASTSELLIVPPATSLWAQSVM